MTPLALITAIRESHPDMVELYTKGQCYAFHRILKTMWPDALAWYANDHVYTEIDGLYYDIQGLHQPFKLLAVRLDKLDSSDHPENWGKRDTRRLIDCGRILQRSA